MVDLITNYIFFNTFQYQHPQDKLFLVFYGLVFLNICSKLQATVIHANLLLTRSTVMRLRTNELK